MASLAPQLRSPNLHYRHQVPYLKDGRHFKSHPDLLQKNLQCGSQLGTLLSC